MIKIFEEWNGHQFNIGDFVRISYATSELIFKIDDWRYSSYDRDYEYELVRLDDERKGWILQKWLRKVPDYEVNAIKYNL